MALSTPSENVISTALAARSTAGRINASSCGVKGCSTKCAGSLRPCVNLSLCEQRDYSPRLRSINDARHSQNQNKPLRQRRRAPLSGVNPIRGRSRDWRDQIQPTPGSLFLPIVLATLLLTSSIIAGVRAVQFTAGTCLEHRCRLDAARFSLRGPPIAHLKSLAPNPHTPLSSSLEFDYPGDAYTTSAKVQISNVSRQTDSMEP